MFFESRVHRSRGGNPVSVRPPRRGPAGVRAVPLTTVTTCAPDYGYWPILDGSFTIALERARDVSCRCIDSIHRLETGGGSSSALSRGTAGAGHPGIAARNPLARL